MTITGTAGHMTVDLFGFKQAIDPTTNHRSFGGRVFLQPNEYANTATIGMKPGYDTKLEWLVALDYDGHDLYIDTRINNNEAQYDKVASTGSDLDNEWVIDGVANQNVQSQVITNWEDNQVTPRKLYGEIGFKQQAGSSTRPGNMYAVYVRFDNDADPSPSVYYEKSGRHPTSTVGNEWTPQDENEPCSAWLMVQQVCHNTNRIIEETRDAWSIPQFDDTTEALT